MRIRKSRNKHRQTAYTVELSEYDAEPPSREWLLDELPNNINPELEAVALYLIFGPWCGGEFIVPQKMGPNTAASISRHAGMDFFPGPIEYYPKGLAMGKRKIRLTNKINDARSRTLVSLNLDEWNGSLRSTTSLILASNTATFAYAGGNFAALIAPAVLLAEELSMTCLDVVDLIDPEDLHEERLLLQAAGVSLAEGERIVDRVMA